MGAISNSISLYSLSICPRTPNFASHTLSTRRRILHTDVMPVRKIPLHERRCVFGVVALLCMSCLVDHCTRSLGHASMPHIILVSVRGGEMRTRREGASGRRISLALHVFGGLFPSTLADRIFWMSTPSTPTLLTNRDMVSRVCSRVTLYNFLAREGQTKVIRQYGITACYVHQGINRVFGFGVWGFRLGLQLFSLCLQKFCK